MPRRHWFALLLVGLPLQRAVAQTDYRNLDAGRPLVTEDAYPTARYAFEFTAPFRMERGVREHRVELAPQLSYGLLRNMMVSIEVPWIARTDIGHTFKAATPRLSTLINFNTESSRWPAFAVRSGSDGHATESTVIATRSFGRVRAHLNVGGSFNDERDGSTESPVNRWAASLASDLTLWRSSLLLAGEFQVARPLGGVRTWRVGAGARWQFTPTLVLDLGAYRTHSAQAGRELGLTFGITQLFGIAGLMPKGGK